MRVSLSKRVFLFFLALTAMSFLVAVAVFLGLERLQDTSQRIGKIQDFRFQVQGLESAHQMPRSPAEAAEGHADDQSVEDRIDWAQALAREIAAEHPDIGPELATRLNSLYVSLDYYGSAMRELRQRSRRDSEFARQMPEVAQQTFEQIEPESPDRGGQLRELFSRLIILRGRTYRTRDLAGIPAMKVLVERIARITPSSAIVDAMRDLVRSTEDNYLNYLGMLDRDAFLHKTSARLFEVADETIAVLANGVKRERRLLLWRINGLIALSLALTFLLWSVTRRYFRRFLNQQEKAIRAIGSGDYDYPATRTSNDELGDLGLFLKQLASDLQESKSHISRLLASTAEAIYGMDLEGKCTFANAACARMLGYASETEILGRQMHRLMHHTRPDGTPYPEQDCGTCRAYREGMDTHSNDEFFWRADGTGFPVEYWSSPIERDGETVGAVVTFFDISRRQAAEAALRDTQVRLQSIMDNSPAVIYLKDKVGRYLLVNRRFEQLFNLASTEILGKTDHDLFPKATAEVLSANDREVLELGCPREFEETVVQADGVHNYISIKFPLLDKDGAAQALCGISSDVTERRRTEEALRRSQKMEAIGQLTGGIAHDFNNLLGIIVGNLELLCEEVEGDESLRRRVDAALRAGLRGADLTKRLLAFSGRSVPETSPLDANQVIEGMRDMLGRALTASITVEMDLADELWFTEINPEELEDSLVNLAINARDAMHGTGVLTVETRNVSLDEAAVQDREGVAAGDYVMVSVSDTGVGIPADQRDHIFQPFFTTKPQSKGTGLGLSMVYGFIKRARGDIRVEAEPGQGARMCLYLPRSSKAKPVDDQTQAPPSESPSGFETVLVVDDEQELAMVAKSGLSRLGYRVLTAGDARQALDSLAAHPTIELLFTDVVMPGGMDGLALAEKATQQYPGLKVLLASGFTQHTEGPKYGRFAGDMLHKPYRTDELATRVREILDREEAI